MRITADDHPHAIHRYGDVRPARWGRSRCGARLPDDLDVTCTREAQHRGPHVAHRVFRRVVAVWDSGPALRALGSERPVPLVRRRATAPVGLRTPSGASRLRELAKRVLRDPPVEEVAMLILLVAFSWFAFDWFRMIMG